MPVAGGLTLEREVAADGAWSLHRLAVSDGESCFPVPLGGGYGCAPRLEGGLGNHYADAACSKAVASYPAAAEGCPAPAYIPRGVPDPAGCGDYKVELLAVGAEVEPSAVYANGGQGRGLLPPVNPARRYYTAGAPLPPDAFPGLAPVPRGSGRLRMTGMEASDGTWLTPGGWGNYESFTDSELEGGTPCEVSYFEDGTYRCTPQSYLSGSSLYYADTACTTPLYLVPKLPNGCTPAPPPRYQTTFGGSVTCSEVPNNGIATEVRPFLAHSGAIYNGAGAGCTPLATDLAAINDLYVLGEPSPLDLFPSLEIRVE